MIDKRYSYDLNANKTNKETFEEKYIRTLPIRDWQLTLWMLSMGVEVPELTEGDMLELK